MQIMKIHNLNKKYFLGVDCTNNDNVECNSFNVDIKTGITEYEINKKNQIVTSFFEKFVKDLKQLDEDICEISNKEFDKLI